MKYDLLLRFLAQRSLGPAGGWKRPGAERKEWEIHRILAI